MAFGSGQDIDITVKVGVDGAITALDKLGNELGTVEKQAKQTNQAMAGAEKSFLSAHKVALATAAGFAVVGASLKGLIAAGARGSEIDDITQAFKRLSTQAGTTSGVLLNQLNAATSKTISNFDLMRQANEALLAGMKPDEFVTLTEAARVLSETVGGSLQQNLDQLNQAFLTGQTRTLKAKIGLIDIDKAQKDFAASIGKAGEKLSEQGKLLAIQAAITERLKEKIAEAGPITDDFGDAIAKVNKALADSAASYQTAIANTSIFQQAIEEVAKTIEQISFDNLAKNAEYAFAAIGIAAAKLNHDITTTLASLLPGDYSGSVKAANSELLASLKVVEELQKKYAQLPGATGKAGKGVKDFGKGLIEASDATKKEAENLKKLIFAIEDATGQDHFPRLADQLREVFQDQYVKSPLAMATNLHKLAIEAKQAGIEFEDFVATMGKAQSQVEGSRGGYLTDDLSSLGESIGLQIGSSIATAISTAIQGQDWEGALGSLAGDLGGIFGAKWGESLGAGLGTFGAALGPVFGALGSSVGTLLVDGITSVFSGGDSAGTKFRKEVDRYFADAFDANRLSVIINGQLQQITDLDFSGGSFGSADSGFFDVFNSLDDQSKIAFSGIATGFSLLLGQGEEFAHNLAAALADNVGGSLENIQRLIDATGQSFDTLSEQLMRSGQTALEVQQQLMALADVMSAGIPGAVGAVGEAMDNLAASIGGPADAMIRAVEDIGAEALELGFNDFGAARAAMVQNLGITASAADQLFQALAIAGITSFQQLENASEETLLAIAANIQAIQQGVAAGFQAVQDPTAAPTPIPRSGGGGGYSGSSGRSSVDKAKQEKQRKNDQFFRELEKLVSESKAYADITNALMAGLKGEAEANTELLAIRNSASKALKEYNKAEKEYNNALKKGSKDLATYAAAVEKARKAVEGFKGVSEKTKPFDPVADFLSGKLNAGDASKQLDLAGAGIPGIKGGVFEAFQNFIKGGTGGGAFTVDALRDIAAEAGESGASSFDGIISILKRKGADATQIQKLFVGLDDLQVRSFDALKNISDETAIKLINTLDQMNFGFQETSPEIKKIVDDLAAIPDEKYVDIILNVSSEFADPQSRALANQILGGAGLPGYGSSGDAPGRAPLTERQLRRNRYLIRHGRAPQFP